MKLNWLEGKFGCLGVDWVNEDFGFMLKILENGRGEVQYVQCAV